MGIAHVAGNYGFTQENFLLEGAEQIIAAGADSIFVYLTPNFRSLYPDRTSGLWTSINPTTLTDLAKSEAFDKVFMGPFKTILLTAYTFANGDQIDGFANSQEKVSSEEQEFYDLAKYLYSQYAGTGKTFVLKNWEGDWIGLGGQGSSKKNQNIAQSRIADINAWLTARQQAVARAREEAGRNPGVNVLNAVEVNRVLDYAQQGLTRVVNAVVPVVQPDIVTYSSYDSTTQGTDPSSLTAAMTLALNTIKELAPDPLGLGDKRIFISEFGLYENEFPRDVQWRTQTVLQNAKAAGLGGAFLWNVFDNECKDPYDQAAPIASLPGDRKRPTDSGCRGLWIVRPDGSTSEVLNILKTYWQ